MNDANETGQTLSRNALLSGRVRVLTVSDEGEVRARLPTGQVDSFLVPIERVPEYRRLADAAAETELDHVAE